jgi:hypothetical protein
MAETADYDPGDWKGHDFASARKSYDVHVGRSYEDAKVKKTAPSTLVPDNVSTNSTAPLVIVTDHTGSMGKWTATMFSKLPYLEIEGKEYLGEDMEICFAAVGDIFSDDYAFQVRPFASGTDLDVRLKELVIEGNGGGQYCESYDVAAAYFANNCDMPKAVNPILIFIGDEGLYQNLAADHAKQWAHIDTDKRMELPAIFAELKKKFTVYLIRKPYGSGYRSSSDVISDRDAGIEKQWLELLDAEHVLVLPEAERVVDVIFGILAKETGRIDYFREELKGRQRPDQVNVVMKSLHSIHAIDDAKSLKKLPEHGKSITRSRRSDAASKPLI